MVIEVTFKGNRREFFEWPFEDVPTVKTAVIVEVDRGEDFGRVHATGDLALKRKAGTTHGRASVEPLKKATRAANGDEIAKATQLRIDELNVRTRAIEKVRTLGLDLKISDTEWQWDKKRLTVYFTAEQRVDFRQLVRQLEGLFGTRVHMWHIGVRDEAKRVDGVGRCGRQLCSASWLPELIPVKSSIAKDQHLSTLNPAQISGACGRLMCCLRYEHEFYVKQRKRFPKEGRIVTTATGEEKVVSLDIFRETVTLRSPVGESRVVPLAQLKLEMQGVSAPVAVDDAEEAHDDGDAADGAESEAHHVMPESPPARQQQRPQEPRPQQQRPQQQRPQQQRPQQQRPQQQRPQQQRPQQSPPPQQRPAQPPRPEGAVPQQGDGEARRGRRGRRRGRRGGGGSSGSTGSSGPGGGQPGGPSPSGGSDSGAQ